MTLLRAFYKLVCSPDEAKERSVRASKIVGVAPSASQAISHADLTTCNGARDEDVDGSTNALAAVDNSEANNETLPRTIFSLHCQDSMRLLLASEARWVAMGPAQSFSGSVFAHALFVCFLCLITLNMRNYTHLPDIHLIDFELTHTNPGVRTPMLRTVDSVTASDDPLSASEGDSKKSRINSLLDLASAKGVLNKRVSQAPHGKKSHSIHVAKLAPVSNRIDDPLKANQPKRVQSPDPNRYALGKADPFARVANSTTTPGAFVVSQTPENYQTRVENVSSSQFRIQPLVSAVRSAPEPAKVTSAPDATPTNLTESQDSGSNFVGSQMVQENSPYSTLIDETGDERLGLENGWQFGQPDVSESSAPRPALSDSRGSQPFLRLSWSFTLRRPVFVGGDAGMVARLNGNWAFGYEFGLPGANANMWKRSSGQMYRVKERSWNQELAY